MDPVQWQPFVYPQKIYMHRSLEVLLFVDDNQETMIHRHQIKTIEFDNNRKVVRFLLVSSEVFRWDIDLLGQSDIDLLRDRLADFVAGYQANPQAMNESTIKSMMDRLERLEDLHKILAAFIDTKLQK